MLFVGVVVACYYYNNYYYYCFNNKLIICPKNHLQYLTNLYSSSFFQGPVGLAVPLRGVGQLSFNCNFKLIDSSSSSSSSSPYTISNTNIKPTIKTKVSPYIGNLEAAYPRYAPELLELPPKLNVKYKRRNKGEGIMLSNVFALQMTNNMRFSLKLNFELEVPQGIQHKLHITLGTHLHGHPECLSYLNSIPNQQGTCKYTTTDSSHDYMGSLGENYPKSVIIAPGQVMHIPLKIHFESEILSDSSSSNNNKSTSSTPNHESQFFTSSGIFHRRSAWDFPTLPCRNSVVYNIIVKPSKGSALRVKKKMIIIIMMIIIKRV